MGYSFSNALLCRLLHTIFISFKVGIKVFFLDLKGMNNYYKII